MEQHRTMIAVFTTRGGAAGSNGRNCLWRQQNGRNDSTMVLKLAVFGFYDLLNSNNSKI